MRVPINIATHPADASRPLRALAITLAAVVLLLGGSLVRSELRTREEFRSLLDRTNQLESNVRDLEATQKEMQSWLETPQVKQIRQRSSLLNALIAQKSLSWTRLFQDLETTLPAGARVTAIAPEADSLKGAQAQPLLNLAVSAGSNAPIVEFIKRLEESPEFDSPVVNSQRFPNATEEKGEIKVALTARYTQSPTQVSAGKKAAAEEDVEVDEDAPEEAAPEAAAPGPKAAAPARAGAAGALAAQRRQEGSR